MAARTLVRSSLLRNRLVLLLSHQPQAPSLDVQLCRGPHHLLRNDLSGVETGQVGHFSHPRPSALLSVRANPGPPLPDRGPYGDFRRVSMDRVYDDPGHVREEDRRDSEALLLRTPLGLADLILHPPWTLLLRAGRGKREMDDGDVGRQRAVCLLCLLLPGQVYPVRKRGLEEPTTRGTCRGASPSSVPFPYFRMP